MVIAWIVDEPFHLLPRTPSAIVTLGSITGSAQAINDSRRYRNGDTSDVAQTRIECALKKIGLRDGLGKSGSGGKEGRIWQTPCTSHDSPQTDTRKHVGVVALGWPKLSAIDFDRRERTSAGEQHSPI